MNRDHRRIIHDLAQVYGLESVSYDSEPKRNVVVTAIRWVDLAVTRQARHWEPLCAFAISSSSWRNGREIHFSGTVFSPLPKDPG